MNKFIFIAVFTVSGLVFVSCSADTEALENANKNQKVLGSPKQNDGLFSREGDSIPMTTTPTEPIVIDGVDDGTMPPKKP
ncbi:hypothetical protein [Flavobacterium sp.]|uniref:hypothetical protein n=1 Tax=Flavobacterium sp. TaxID=239 RepID=UPI002B4B40D6|nr:hypothetical protein [Flavobacterium sp.]HLF53235.1 hypothetical protein [Flavobacterium sp.]